MILILIFLVFDIALLIYLIKKYQLKPFDLKGIVKAFQMEFGRA